MTEFIDQLFSLKGKVAVVTGGSAGIGAFIAEGFVKAGAQVYVAARGADDLVAVVRKLSPHGLCSPVVADLATMAGARTLADQILHVEPAVHILVNNAGRTFGATLEEFPDDELDLAWSVNVKAVFHLTRFLLPALRTAATVDAPATVINVSSVSGSMVPPIAGHTGYAHVPESWGYCASKAGLNMLTRHLAQRLAADNITVNAIAPGPFESRMTAPHFADPAVRAAVEAMVPMRRVGTPMDVQGATIFLASRAGTYLTGAILPVDGGWSSHG